MDTQKKLYRSNTDKMLCGVCGGLAEYLNIDPVLVRLMFVALFFVNGVSLLAYIVLCIVMPEKGTTAVPSGSNGRKAATEDKPQFEPLGSRSQEN